MSIPEQISRIEGEMREWRHDIHAHPELGFEEERTAAIVAAKLQSFGIEVHKGIGKTGVVGILKSGNAKRTVGLRADMDALPIQETNSFAHKSRHDGGMHACGHDGHTAMLLGAAKHLAQTRHFDGTVHFILQPGEEGIGGARAMIEDGLFKRFPAKRCSACTTGRGCRSHGARPESGVDPVLVAAHIATAAQSIVSRNLRPVETAVVSVTQIHAGDAYNVIPQSARLSGTARAFSNEVMGMIGRNLARIAEGVAAGFGARARIFAPLINDPGEAEFAAGVCNEIVGADRVRRDPALIMASEDFSFMLAEVPGCYINIGNGDGAGSCEVHNPSYDFNDAALPYGASFFARLVEKRLTP
jgi:hippurate hydrolase